MRAFLLIVVFGGLLVGTVRAGSTSSAKCAAAKAKAAGAEIYGKTKCHQKALATGSAADPACLTKAQEKRVAAFAKADASGGCTATGDAAVVQALVDACLTSFIGAITGNATCAAAKMRAVGKKAYAKAKCHQKALLKGTGLDPLCLEKTEGKFTAAITKADGQGTCSDTAPVLEALVDACVGGLISLDCATSTFPTCGGSCPPGQVCQGTTVLAGLVPAFCFPVIGLGAGCSCVSETATCSGPDPFDDIEFGSCPGDQVCLATCCFEEDGTPLPTCGVTCGSYGP